MKKIAYFLFLIFCISCNVDSVQSDLVPINGPVGNPIDPECEVDTNNPPAVMGTTWLRTSLVIETPIDGNNDGIFATELIGEYSCTADALIFDTDFTVGDPQYDNFQFEVINDGSGNLSQQITCLTGDGQFPIYTQDQNTLYFCYNGELSHTATLSNNQQTMTFNLDYDDFFFQNNEILNADGTVTDYQGGIIITYTRQ